MAVSAQRRDMTYKFRKYLFVGEYGMNCLCVFEITGWWYACIVLATYSLQQWQWYSGDVDDDDDDDDDDADNVNVDINSSGNGVNRDKARLVTKSRAQASVDRL